MDRRQRPKQNIAVSEVAPEVEGILFGFLSERSAREVWGLAAATILALGMVDILTGPQLGLSPFYLVPVLALAWAQGRTAAWAASGVAAVMWLVADVVARHQPLGTWIHLWNATTRLSLWGIAAGLVVKLRQAHQREREAARTDPLTGVMNSRWFDTQLGRLLDEARERNIPVSFAYIDIDHFKLINDSLGHSAGDRVLREVAEILRRSLRTDDILARLGGDEFGIALLGETEDARTPLERAREAIRVEVQPVRPTVSIGLATFLEAPATVDEMIHAADSLMYEVKESGRDQLKHRLITQGVRLSSATPVGVPEAH